MDAPKEYYRWLETSRVECASHEEAKEKLKAFGPLLPKGEHAVVVGNALIFVIENPQPAAYTRYSYGFTDWRGVYGTNGS